MPCLEQMAMPIKGGDVRPKDLIYSVGGRQHYVIILCLKTVGLMLFPLAAMAGSYCGLWDPTMIPNNKEKANYDPPPQWSLLCQPSPFSTAFICKQFEYYGSEYNHVFTCHTPDCRIGVKVSSWYSEPQSRWSGFEFQHLLSSLSSDLEHVTSFLCASVFSFVK